VFEHWEDGNDFTDVSRSIYSSEGGCELIRCEAGSDGTGCDYPKQVGCPMWGGYFHADMCVDIGQADNIVMAAQVKPSSTKA
jgi:hypothetical protein